MKKSLRTIKSLDPRTLKSLEDAIDKEINDQLEAGENFAILYLDANNL